ncbi:MAG TPA: hypothetical protein VMY38_08375 [Gemmatimonadaceae bacterium]|nr:hypothetical protein [Gemmatimonadaceae bacterium]
MQADPQQRIIDRDQLREQIRQTIETARDAGVVTQGPTGVATTAPAWDPADIPPRAQEVAIASLFTLATIIIGFPIARALARRIDRSGIAPRVPTEVTSQLAQLNQAVESIAIEVERISEGQRFTTKLLSEQHKLPAATRNVS